MKKNNVFMAAAFIIMTATAFSIVNRNDYSANNQSACKTEHAKAESIVEYKDKEDFVYNVGTRFGGIKKSELDKIRSFNDLISADHASDIDTYLDLSIIILDDFKETEIRETVKGGMLNEAQIKLLKSTSPSTNVLFKANYLGRVNQTGDLKVTASTPHFTVVPEHQAEYMGGKEAIIDYLIGNTLNETADVQKDQLKPGKLYFTVSQSGQISNVNLSSSCGYEQINQKVMKSIQNLPGDWKPAMNEKGEYVEQDLVISFGIVGC